MVVVKTVARSKGSQNTFKNSVESFSIFLQLRFNEIKYDSPFDQIVLETQIWSSDVFQMLTKYTLKPQ